MANPFFIKDQPVLQYTCYELMLPSAPAQAAPGTLPHTQTRLKNYWLLYKWFLSLQECELMKTKPLHLLAISY